MKTRLNIFTALLLFSHIAVAQVDTIDFYYPYYYPCYQLPGICVYDSAAHCTMTFTSSGSSIILASFEGCRKDGVLDGILYSDIRNAFVGCIADSDMDILGMAQPSSFTDELYPNLREDFFVPSVEFIMALASGVAGMPQIHRSYIFREEDVEAAKILTAYYNTSHIYERRYKFFDLMEFWFDSVYHVSAGDTFYMAIGYIDTIASTPDDTVIREHAVCLLEYHSQDYTPNPDVSHFPEFQYMANICGQWQSGTIHALPFLWAIVRFPGDTCPAPQELRATPIAEGTEFIQFDTMSNHTVWQVCYGPEGSSPNDGTIVETVIPQTVIGNLNPEQRYVAYCRARCDFAQSEWSPWSDSVGFRPTIAAIATAASLTLTLSPNPVGDEVRVACSHAMHSVVLYAADGTAVLAVRPDATEATIDLRQLPAGAYTVVATTTAGSAVRHLVRQ